MILQKKGPMQTNLDSFLDSITPIVPSQSLTKSEMKNLNRLWHPSEKEKVEYFRLADFWKCFDEWSAYGADVPISLDNCEPLVQYYVPYLSAIQIFTSNPSPVCLSDETDSSCETRDSLSDSFSEDSESEKLSRWDGSFSDDGVFDNDIRLWNSDERLGYLYFQFFERCTPYGRIPLMDKIRGLAERYPGLMSLRSVDLSPASWISVAWYPIYHIPLAHTIKDLSTCFLSYHTLSSSFQDSELEDDIGYVEKERKEEGIRVPSFGLASYKMYGDVWISNRSVKDQERLVSLSSVANSWLKQLNVQHHDFNYFMGIRHG